MADITQALLENIQKDNDKRFGTSTTIRALSKKIKNNTATYTDAFRYAKEVGNIRAKTLKNQINPENLPDGRMYYNIAKPIFNDSLKTDYKRVSSICAVAQSNKNKKMRLSVKPVETDIDQDNIDSIIDMVSANEDYSSTAELIEMACATFAKHIVDQNMKSNADFQNRIGLKVTIVRTSAADCCPWCTDKAGSYSIDSAPDDVWSRHNDCNCMIDYNSR